MLPDNCALTVSDGRIIIVDRLGDVAADDGYCGIYDTDHRVFSGVSVSLDADGTVDWDVLGRTVECGKVTTTVASTTVGPGRGDQRAWTLTKQFAATTNGVAVDFALRNNTSTRQSGDLVVELLPGFDHIFEVPSFFSPRDSPTRDSSVDDIPEGLVCTSTGVDGRQHRAAAVGSNEPTVAAESNQGTITWSLTLEPAEEIQRTIRLNLSKTTEMPPIDHNVTSTEYSTLTSAARRTLEALTVSPGVPAAGAPRFVAPFGRDSLIVSYQLLPYDVTLAKRTLAYLASEQGTTTDTNTLEAPGKILHEHRRGDFVGSGHSLRRPYYGTVDATPLFVSLFADTYGVSGDEDFRDDLYDAADAAVDWILNSLGSDSLLGYEPHDHPYGLSHLGWKDSSDAIVHPEGTPATGSIRLSEVQGYVYRALTRFAPIAREVGDTSRAETCLTTADAISDTFESAFWLPDEGCYALAIDDNGAVPSVASNQTHALWGGLGTTDRVKRAVARLTESDILSENGLRTFASSHPAYDPLSYHRGSIWPHDNSIAAMAFAERGFEEVAQTVARRGLNLLTQQYETARPDRFGFPELVPGITVQGGTTGTLRHPDACEPAAWSAGAVFGFMQARSGTC